MYIQNILAVIWLTIYFTVLFCFFLNLTTCRTRTQSFESKHFACMPIIRPLCGTRTQEIYNWKKKTLNIIHVAIMFPSNVLCQQISAHVISGRQGESMRLSVSASQWGWGYMLWWSCDSTWKKKKNIHQSKGKRICVTENLQSGQVLSKEWAWLVWSNCINLGLSPGASLHFINHMNVCFIPQHCSHWSFLLQVLSPRSSNITFLST